MIHSGNEPSISGYIDSWRQINEELQELHFIYHDSFVFIRMRAKGRVC